MVGGPGPAKVSLNEKIDCSLGPGAMKYPGGPHWLLIALTNIALFGKGGLMPASLTVNHGVLVTFPEVVARRSR